MAFQLYFMFFVQNSGMILKIRCTRGRAHIVLPGILLPGALAISLLAAESDDITALYQRGNAAFQSDNYAAAYHAYDCVFQEKEIPFNIKRSAYYRREQCILEVFTAIDRALLSGNLDRAEDILTQAKAFAARGAVENAQHALFSAKLMHARRNAVEGLPGGGDRTRRYMVGGQAASFADPEFILHEMLKSNDPFAPANVRSEAWFLLWQWAQACGDQFGAAIYGQGLLHERSPDPFWAAQINGNDKTAGCGNSHPRLNFATIQATAGAPRSVLTAGANWLRRISVRSLAELCACFDKLRRLPESARLGQIVFVPGGYDWDLSGINLEIPEGVILAGDRGMDGAPGSILRCRQVVNNKPCVTMRSRTRITGLRLRGERDWSGTAPPPEVAGKSPKSDIGTGIVQLWDASHGLVDNCDIAGFGRNGVQGFGHYLRVAHCHIHDIGWYGVALSVYGSHLLVENSRIEWNWQAIGGGRSMIVGYEIRGCVIEDARRQETAQLENGTEYFRYGTALGHHSDMGGLRLHVWNNVFLRVDERVLSMRTVSPRNGPAGGMLAHDNWFAQPYLAAQPPEIRADVLAILRKRNKSGDALALNDYVAGKDYDPREMEIRLRKQMANLWAWRNYYGSAGAEIPVSCWTAPMMQWLLPRTLPPTFRLDHPASIETILRLRPRPDGSVSIPLAWRVRMFPGRQMSDLSVKLTGPFTEVLPAIGKDALFVKEIYRETVADRTESARVHAAEVVLPASGFYRLDLRVKDMRGYAVHYPCFFYYESD